MIYDICTEIYIPVIMQVDVDIPMGILVPANAWPACCVSCLTVTSDTVRS
jgi:hypothetical protein